MIRKTRGSHAGGILRIAALLLLAFHISSCYALALAAPTESESNNQFDTAMARRQSFDENAEMVSRTANQPIAEQKAAIESIRMTKITSLPADMPLEEEPQSLTARPWTIIGAVAGVPIGAFLLILWLTHRAMKHRQAEHLAMLRRIRPSLAAEKEGPKEAPKSKKPSVELKFVLAASWAERKRQAEEAMAGERSKLPTTAFEPPPKPVVPLMLRAS